MITKDILYFGAQCTVACDALCEKAWGINSRPREQLPDDPDDYAFLSDAELETAPLDPGTYEGGHPKPRRPCDRLNKWCVRECERSVLVDRGQEPELGDWSHRIFNLPTSPTPTAEPTPNRAAENEKPAPAQGDFE